MTQTTQATSNNSTVDTAQLQILREDPPRQKLGTKTRTSRQATMLGLLARFALFSTLILGAKAGEQYFLQLGMTPDADQEQLLTSLKNFQSFYDVVEADPSADEPDAAYGAKVELRKALQEALRETLRETLRTGVWNISDQERKIRSSIVEKIQTLQKTMGKLDVTDATEDNVTRYGLLRELRRLIDEVSKLGEIRPRFIKKDIQLIATEAVDEFMRIKRPTFEGCEQKDEDVDFAIYLEMEGDSDTELHLAGLKEILSRAPAKLDEESAKVANELVEKATKIMEALETPIYSIISLEKQCCLYSVECVTEDDFTKRVECIRRKDPRWVFTPQMYGVETLETELVHGLDGPATVKTQQISQVKDTDPRNEDIAGMKKSESNQMKQLGTTFEYLLNRIEKSGQPTYMENLKHMRTTWTEELDIFKGMIERKLPDLPKENGLQRLLRRLAPGQQ